MEANYVSSSISICPLLSFPCTNPPKSKHKIAHFRVLGARGNDQHYSGKLVDSNMIVLRKRIHETNMVERNYEPPEDWMDWEKQVYTSYDEFICKAVGLVQFRLMNTRPCFALVLVGLLTLSVPFSVAMVLFRLMEIAHGI